MLSKYWQIYKISLQQEFAYKINFIMWRIRNLFQIILTYFLWSSVFSDPERLLFGYDRGKIMTYVFGIMLVKAFIFSSRAIDVAGDISRGDLSNYLVKPLNYFKYWLTRDLASKSLNLIFAVVEFTLLFLILRPEFYFQTDILLIFLFLISLIIANFIYFSLIFSVSSIPFWAPELAWGSHFLVTVVVAEFLSGALFPIDILPPLLQKILMATPFPYLIFFPIEIYLGKLSIASAFQGISISLLWLGVMLYAMKFIWKKGLVVYQASGR